MKCLNINRLVGRLVVSLLIKFEWVAHCEKPGVSRRSTTCIIMSQPRKLNITLTLIKHGLVFQVVPFHCVLFVANNLQMQQWLQEN
jgi:hypothetical protein